MEYVGKYAYTREAVYITVMDEEGTSSQVFDHYDHSYTQKTGELRRGGAKWELEQVLPLYNDLDIRFAGQFEVPIGQRSPLDGYAYDRLSPSLSQPTSPHTVTLKADADVDTYGGLTDEVTVEAVLNAKGELTLTASLTNHPEYVMEAVLEPSGKLEQLLVLSSHETDGIYETKPVQWALGRIVKKEAADEETP